jgi:hypothetical protein
LHADDLPWEPPAPGAEEDAGGKTAPTVKRIAAKKVKPPPLQSVVKSVKDE